MGNNYRYRHQYIYIYIYLYREAWKTDKLEPKGYVKKAPQDQGMRSFKTKSRIFKRKKKNKRRFKKVTSQNSLQPTMNLSTVLQQKKKRTPEKY